jgi:glutamate synthase domain-containing protein 2
MEPRKIFFWLSFLVWPLFIAAGIYGPQTAPLSIVVSLIFVLGWYDVLQTKRAILRDYPVIGHIRYILRAISPEIHQYFIENNTNGTPFNKETIELVNKRSDNEDAFHPFGTELDLYEERYQWAAHALFPKKRFTEPPRVTVGSDACKQPYSASIFNVSAMSFGALGKNAVEALNRGAKLGGFAHNTGEGGLSPYHLQGGDVIMQVGTANFGFRNDDGTLNEEAFREKSALPQVKMVEIKLSQGAKPGHGGLLPAAKNTHEIAQIRMVKPATDVFSPPVNASFDSPEGLAHFIGKLRELSGGKPVGIKLCIGSTDEFADLIRTFQATDIFPDFITVDAAEGGTGAAPIEYSDSIGMRGEDALRFVHRTLKEMGVRERLKVIYAGKVISGFTLLKALCLGADLCNSARGFMFSLGCIQSLRCHTNTCPTGVATQDKTLQEGLVPEDKYKRVANFHKNTVASFLELASTLGNASLDELDERHIRTSHTKL